MMEVENILKSFENAKSVKQSWMSDYQDVYNFVLPHRKGGMKPLVNGEIQEEKSLYSSVAINSANNFVSKMQQIITPINQDWLGISLTNDENTQTNKETNDTLSQLSKLMNNFKNASNFDSVITEFYLDLVAGTACLLVLPGTQKEPLKFKTIPFYEYCFTEASDGVINQVFRNFNLTREEIKYTWSEAPEVKTEKDDEKIEILECVKFNTKTLLWDYLVINIKTKSILVKRTYKTNPFIILRWNKASGEWYGRGVGLMALPDIKTLNMIMDFSLRADSYQLPILIADQNRINENFDIRPMSVNFVEYTSTNEPPIQQLQFNSRNDISNYNKEMITMQIKRAMLDNTILDDGKPRTATEVAQRIQELQNTTSTMFGRIIVDFLIPLTKRIIECLQVFNYIDKEQLDINAIDGFVFKVKVETPLARQNNLDTLQNLSQAFQYFQQVDPSGQLASRYLKLDDIIPYFSKLLGVPEKFIKSNEEIQQSDEQQAIAQQQMQEQVMDDEIYLNDMKEQGKENAKRNI